MPKKTEIEVTGESAPRKAYIPPKVKVGAVAIAAVVFIVGLSGGVFIGKASGSTNSVAARDDDTQFPSGMQDGNFPGEAQGGGMGMLGGGNTGEVMAVSASSITVKDQRSGGLTTFDITSDTNVTDDGDSATIADVQVGDTVMAQGTDDEDDSAAGTITLNPSTPTRGQFQ